MPKKGNGDSLKQYRAFGWFGSENTPGERVEEFIVTASTLTGAVGRAAREARKKIKGRYTMATINIESI